MQVLHACYFKQRIYEFNGKGFPSHFVIFNLKREKYFKGLHYNYIQKKLPAWKLRKWTEFLLLRIVGPLSSRRILGKSFASKQTKIFI